MVAQVGYVGSEGRHLLSILDINQEELGAGGGARPYDGELPTEWRTLYSFINQIESIGTSNYNSLQATVRVSNCTGSQGRPPIRGRTA